MPNDAVRLNKTYTLGTPGSEAVREVGRRRRRQSATTVGLTRELMRQAAMRQQRLDGRRSPVEPMS